MWQKSYGGENWDIPASIKTTTDGGYIVAGRSYSGEIKGVKNNGRDDFYVLKLKKDGNIEWHRMIGGSNADWAYAISQTSDGGYIISGDTQSSDIKGFKNNGRHDSYIVKLDKKGNIQWQNVTGGKESDVIASIVQLDDGSYVGAGYSYSEEINGVQTKGSWDMYMINLSKEGK